MASNPRLHQILDQVAARMLADFESSALVTHRGSKGAVREEAVRRFLSDYLPHSAQVAGSGELISTTGDVSGQCDIMVLDANAPPLWQDKGYRIVPAECCYATIEVKSNLTKDELRGAWNAATALKSLPRVAYLKDPSPFSYTRISQGRPVTEMPPQVHVFAYEGATLDALGEELNRLSSLETGPSVGIDSVSVLDRGFLAWADLEKGTLSERRERSRIGAFTATSGQVLWFLTTFLNSHVSKASKNPQFDISQYAPEGLGTLHGMWPELPPKLLSEARDSGIFGDGSIS